MSIIDVIIISLVVNYAIFFCVYLICKSKKSNEFMGKIENETVLYVDEYYNHVFFFYCTSSLNLFFVFILIFMFFEIIPNEIDYAIPHILLIIISTQCYRIQLYRYAEKWIREFIVTNKTVYIKTLLHKKLVTNCFYLKRIVPVSAISEVKSINFNANLLSSVIIFKLKDNSIIKMYEYRSDDDVVGLLKSLIRGDW